MGNLYDEKRLAAIKAAVAMIEASQDLKSLSFASQSLQRAIHVFVKDCNIRHWGVAKRLSHDDTLQGWQPRIPDDWYWDTD